MAFRGMVRSRRGVARSTGNLAVGASSLLSWGSNLTGREVQELRDASHEFPRFGSAGQFTAILKLAFVGDGLRDHVSPLRGGLGQTSGAYKIEEIPVDLIVTLGGWDSMVMAKRIHGKDDGVRRVRHGDAWRVGVLLVGAGFRVFQEQFGLCDLDGREISQRQSPSCGY